MSKSSTNSKSPSREFFEVIGAVLGIPLVLFTIVNSISEQPLIALIVTLITAVLLSIWLYFRGISFTYIIIAWLSLTVIILLAFVIWPKTMTLEGYVNDTSGNPIAYETVNFFDYTGRIYETKTNQSGFYQFVDVPTGKYKIRVRATEIQGETKGLLVRVVSQSISVDNASPTLPTTVSTGVVTPTIIAVAPTETPIPLTHTPVPPTDTPVLPTNTPVSIPTNTPKPTDTPQSPTATPSEIRKLEIFNWWTASGSESEASNAMFKVFKDKYPGVEVVENPKSNGNDDNRAVLAARITTGIPPDTFQTLGGTELKSYFDRGTLQPLDDLWAELKYKDVIPGPLAKSVTINGHPYLMPLNINIQNILYYNQKLFNELKLRAPTTFDEMMTVCAAIKQAKPDMACLGLGSQDKWSDAFVFDSVLLAEGGPEYYVKLYKGEIDVTNDATFKSALEKFSQLASYINKNHSDLLWNQSVDLVGSNQAAMVIMGTWAIGAFAQGSNWQPGVDFGAVIFPSKPDRILLFHPDGYGLAKNAPHPETAMNWLRVVASPELQIRTDIIQGGLFARVDIDPKELPDPIRQEMQGYIRNNPDKLILNQFSIVPVQSVYWDIISSYLAGSADTDATIKAVANMMTNYKVKEALAWYQWP